MFVGLCHMTCTVLCDDVMGCHHLLYRNNLPSPLSPFSSPSFPLFSLHHPPPFLFFLSSVSHSLFLYTYFSPPLSPFALLPPLLPPSLSVPPSIISSVRFLTDLHRHGDWEAVVRRRLQPGTSSLIHHHTSGGSELPRMATRTAEPLCHS